MKPKTALTKLKPLLKFAYFSSTDARELGVSAATLSYYAKRGDLERIGHGVYRGIKSPVICDFRWEDLANTLSKINNGVICLTSALALYNLTDEIPKQHWIAIPNDTSHRAEPLTKIVRLRNMELGITTITIEGFKLPIFDRERTIVDAFRLLSLETAIKALRNGLKSQSSGKISITKIRRYAKILRVKIEPYLLGVLPE